jgi:DNA replication protein DnaC
MRKSRRGRRSPLASVRRSDSGRNISHSLIDSPNESECSNCLIQHVFGILARNRAIERRIRQAKFPVVKTMDSFDFLAIPALNKALVLELARCEFLARRENVLLLGNSGTGKTHIALALGLAACQRGHRVRFTTTAALVSELIEARDEKKLLRFQKQIASYELLIVDELGFVPLSKTGAELLFEMLSQRYERGSTMVTSNLPFQEWTEILGSERLTGALLDRLTHHVHILEMNGDSYRLKQSRHQRTPSTQR